MQSATSLTPATENRWLSGPEVFADMHRAPLGPHFVRTSWAWPLNLANGHIWDRTKHYKDHLLVGSIKDKWTSVNEKRLSNQLFTCRWAHSCKGQNGGTWKFRPLLCISNLLNRCSNEIVGEQRRRQRDVASKPRAGKRLSLCTRSTPRQGPPGFSWWPKVLNPLQLYPQRPCVRYCAETRTDRVRTICTCVAPKSLAPAPNPMLHSTLNNRHRQMWKA